WSCREESGVAVEQASVSGGMRRHANLGLRDKWPSHAYLRMLGEELAKKRGAAAWCTADHDIGCRAPVSHGLMLPAHGHHSSGFSGVTSRRTKTLSTSPRIKTCVPSRLRSTIRQS